MLGRTVGGLQTELNLEPAWLQVLAYGLEAVLGGLVQLIILAILPLILGIGPGPGWRRERRPFFDCQRAGRTAYRLTVVQQVL